MNATVRRARPDEAELLSRLARASKQAWGYDEVFLAAVDAELAVTPDDVRQNECYVAEQDGAVAGFYLLVDDSLERLFVSPDRMRRGVGRTLFAHATSRLAGRTLRVVCDPNAAPFYERLGARYIGRDESAFIAGRSLPVYEFTGDD